MTTGRDDDAALSWDGDDDPTLDVRAPAPGPASELPGADPAGPDAAPVAEPEPLPDGFTPVGKGSAAYGAGHAGAGDDAHVPAAAGAPASTGEPAPIGNTALVALGVLGGVYLLYTIGWIVGGLRLRDVAVFLVSPAAYLPAFVLAVLAPAIWFTTTYVLTRAAKTWLRFAWLAVGAMLLVPWPFIMVGAFGR